MAFIKYLLGDEVGKANKANSEESCMLKINYKFLKYDKGPLKGLRELLGQDLHLTGHVEQDGC